jgi:hypothetical protein
VFNVRVKNTGQTKVRVVASPITTLAQQFTISAKPPLSTETVRLEVPYQRSERGFWKWTRKTVPE